jgi:hypothetical protein
MMATIALSKKGMSMTRKNSWIRPWSCYLALFSWLALAAGCGLANEATLANKTPAAEGNSTEADSSTSDSSQSLIEQNNNITTGDVILPTDSDAESCLNCHPNQAEAWQNESSHQLLYSCAFCHMAVLPNPGPGHRAKPWCDSCHSEKTHIPTYGNAEAGALALLTCLSCHDPHGSKNSYLIQEQILAGPQQVVNVRFNNTAGLAAGSYAEPGSQAGTGLCEVCHQATSYYNQTGTGSSHYRSSCRECHDHSAGFHGLAK